MVAKASVSVTAGVGHAHDSLEADHIPAPYMQ